MDCRLLTGDHLDLTDYRFGTPQQAGCLTVVPITTQQASNVFRPPLEAEGIRYRSGVGSPILKNHPELGCILAPLHFGIPVERSKSLILSHAILLPRTERMELNREMCYLYQSSRRIRFDLTHTYILPLALRGPAWRARQSTDVARLLPEMNDLDIRMSRLGLGSLSAAVQARTPQLQSLTRRIELLSGQTGALFYLEDKPVGLEIAPSPAYFAPLWQPLLVGCYGLAALMREHYSPVSTPALEPFAVSRLSEVRTEMFHSRHQRQELLEAAVAGRLEDAITIEEEQRWQNYRVQSLTGTEFAGQYVEEVTPVKAEAEGEGAMPRMLRNLFRKGTAPADAQLQRRIVYTSIFALTVS